MSCQAEKVAIHQELNRLFGSRTGCNCRDPKTEGYNIKGHTADKQVRKGNYVNFSILASRRQGYFIIPLWLTSNENYIYISY